MPHNIKRAVRLCGLFTLIAVAGGCQRGSTLNLASVEGTVTMNGQPLPHVEVTFYPDIDAGTQGPRSTAVTDASGHYRLQAHDGESGAIVGKHRIVVQDTEARTKRRGPSAGGPKEKEAAPSEAAGRQGDQKKLAAKASRIPPNCADFNKTQLRVEIQSGAQVIDFEVKETDVEVKLMGAPGK